ncbi:MAG: GPW/gp25 family protein [Anaerolineae bacterium]|jgi:phage baseplate assembly protein W|nr:GPW/gp25 family protein [Anaerolineae bacterium]
MNIDYPWHFDNKGRTATTGDNEHIRDMLEQLIFTSPGERVNRPELGTGVMQRVFAPNSPEIAAALQFTMQAAIQRWLGDLIELQGLMVESREALQLITIQYTVRRTGQDQVATLTREV